MQEKQFVLIRANRYDIDVPEFFDTYYEAHDEMKRQYEIWSRNCIGELNDDDAWCMNDDGCITNWKIFDMQLK